MFTRVKINPRIAAGLAPLLNLQLRAIETTDVERRLARLEKLSAAEEKDRPAGERKTGKLNFGGPSPVTKVT